VDLAVRGGEVDLDVADEAVCEDSNHEVGGEVAECKPLVLDDNCFNLAVTKRDYAFSLALFLTHRVPDPANLQLIGLYCLQLCLYPNSHLTSLIKDEKMTDSFNSCSCTLDETLIHLKI